MAHLFFMMRMKKISFGDNGSFSFLVWEVREFFYFFVAFVQIWKRVGVERGNPVFSASLTRNIQNWEIHASPYP